MSHDDEDDLDSLLNELDSDHPPRKINTAGRYRKESAGSSSPGASSSSPTKSNTRNQESKRLEILLFF
ncbi:hypothetical protein HDU76_003792 [Blyttiomyces sp. JEL0837]|nr:hypothetical protein HDU76_003792 [Blyttiomyces sp. JEL0837]